MIWSCSDELKKDYFISAYDCKVHGNCFRDLDGETPVLESAKMLLVSMTRTAFQSITLL
jgi:hypothetical protein